MVKVSNEFLTLSAPIGANHLAPLNDFSLVFGVDCENGSLGDDCVYFTSSAR